MQLIEDRKNSPISLTCRYGRNLELREGASVFTVGGRKITLNNVPLYHCFRCNESIFDWNIDVDGALRYAYKNGLNSISFKQFES